MESERARGWSESRSIEMHNKESHSSPSGSHRYLAVKADNTISEMFYLGWAAGYSNDFVWDREVFWFKFNSIFTDRSAEQPSTLLQVFCAGKKLRDCVFTQGKIIYWDRCFPPGSSLPDASKESQTAAENFYWKHQTWPNRLVILTITWYERILNDFLFSLRISYDTN